jgi:hypothetical protein
MIFFKHMSNYYFNDLFVIDQKSGSITHFVAANRTLCVLDRDVSEKY